MSGNLFGKMFRAMTFGESHGPAVGVVIDGVKPGVEIDLAALQRELDRRRPGQNPLTTARQEKDRLQILSGIFEGKTTGTPICILIPNQDQRPGDYRALKDILRPGHAAFTYLEKYGIFDYRGGGRASARETAARVAAGAIARQLLERRGVDIYGFTCQVGEIQAETVDRQAIEKNPVRCPDPRAAEMMAAAIRQAREEGDSLGGVVEVRVNGLPAGLGEPVFNRLEADLAAAMLSIGAVKGFEVGSGFAAALQKGSEHNDPFAFDEENKTFYTTKNDAGGVLGGISSGAELVMRLAVKPPSSITKAQQTVDSTGRPRQIRVTGRHDPCICPRVVPVAEAMAALVLIDHLLMQERIDDHPIREKIETIDTQLLLLLLQRELLTGAATTLTPERVEALRKKLRKFLGER